MNGAPSARAECKTSGGLEGSSALVRGWITSAFLVKAIEEALCDWECRSGYLNSELKIA